MSFGELLRRYRGLTGLTQEELAERSGLSVAAISLLERGVRRAPQARTVELLARALGLRPDERELLLAARRPRLPAPDQDAARQTLPRDVVAFTGRAGELERLIAAVTGAMDSGLAAGIVAIDGMPGVGKTTLAIHAAHRLAPRFPDGQLFLELHAHTAGQRPLTTADALRALLLTTGMTAQSIPPDTGARAALWRDRLAGRRVLIVLDDAADHEQVRPLLPGVPGCLVLITSRRRLAALEDVQPLTLGTLPPAEAASLLRRLVGERAGDAEHDEAAVAELVELCGYLPLAIALLAGRLRSHPAWSVQHLAGSLRAAQDRLAELQAENVAVEAAFRLSYQELPDDQQRLFRRLGRHPGREIDASAAAALDAGRVVEVRRRLEALYGQHLLDEPAAGRYRLHDLIRDYARALASADPESDAAVDRLLDYYLRATAAAVPELAARKPALAWLEAERENLVACLDLAVAHGRPGLAVQLAHAMHPFLRAAGHWEQAIAVHRTALAAADLAGDRKGRADVLDDLGVVQQLTGDYEAAAASLTEALTLFRALDDRTGQARALNDWGIVQHLRGDYEAATGSLREALALFRELGDRMGESVALGRLGQVDLSRGRYEAAAASLARTLAISRELEDRIGQANALSALGMVRLQTGEYDAATAALTEALGLYRDLDMPFGQANAVGSLGTMHLRSGRPEEAIPSLLEAGELFRELGNRHGLAAALADLGIAQRLTGQAQAAARSLGESLAISCELGYRLGEAEVRNSLGGLWLHRGRAEDALDHHRQALRIARDIEAPFEEARALEGIGRCLVRGPDAEAGVVHLRQALAIYERLQVPDSDRVAATLHELVSASQPGM